MIGNGMAGIRTIEELISRDANRYDITVVGKEPYPNYNRIMLSNILQNKMTVEETIMNSYEWYEENHITLINDDPVEKVDRQSKNYYTKGIELEYDICIFATGSKAFVLPIEGLTYRVLSGGERYKIQNKSSISLVKRKSYCHRWWATWIRVRTWFIRPRYGCHSTSSC